MQLEIYQWLVPLVAGFFIIRTIRQHQKHARNIAGTIIWLAFWVSLILLAVVPDLISFRVAEMLGFKSNINAVIFIGLGFLFLIVFYLSDAQNRLERRMTELIRELAKERATKAEEEKEEVTSEEQKS